MKRNGEKTSVDGDARNVKGGGNSTSMADGSGGGGKVVSGVAGSQTLTTEPDTETITREEQDSKDRDESKSASTGSEPAQESQDRISYVHTGSDVEDVVRSGIVSRILATVSGGAEKAGTKPKSPQSLSQDRKPVGSSSPHGNQKSHATSPKPVHPYSSPSGAASPAENNTSVHKSSTMQSGSKATSGVGASIPTAITSPASPSNKRNLSNNAATNQNSSISAKSVIDERQTPPVGDSLRPSPSDSNNSVQRDGHKGEGKSVSVLDIKRVSGGSKDGKGTQSDASSEVQRSKSGKSRETNNQQGQSYSPYARDYAPFSTAAKGTIAADIPQSLSADSGIGSPTDANVGIDPEEGSMVEGSEDGKWRGEITAAGSSATQIVTPHLPDRSDNYRPCTEPGDAPSLSSLSDTSNYLPGSETSDRQSFHANRFSQHASNPNNSSTANEKRNSKVNAGTLGDVKGVNSNNSITSGSSFTTQNATNYDQDTSNLPDDHSTSSNTQISKASATNVKYSSGQEAVKNSSVIDVEKASSVIQTLHTTEFTIESESGVAKISPNNILSSSERASNEDKTSTAKSGVNGSAIEGFVNGQIGNTAEENSPVENGGVQRTPNHVDEQGSLKNQVVTSSEGGTVKDGEAVVFYSEESSESDKQAPEKPKRKKPTLRDVSLQDVIALADSPNSDRKIKGILKTTSAPTLNNGKLEKAVQGLGLAAAKNGVSREDLAATRSVSFKKTHTKSTFSYYNAAFEGEIITEPSKRPSLADVVSHIMRQSSIIDIDDDNSHPYGRDSSLTDLMTGKRRENYNMDAGKMIVWLALAIMIVSLAGGIIFMSENYNLHSNGQEVVLENAYDTTTPKIAS